MESTFFTIDTAEENVDAVLLKRIYYGQPLPNFDITETRKMLARLQALLSANLVRYNNDKVIITASGIKALRFFNNGELPEMIEENSHDLINYEHEDMVFEVTKEMLKHVLSAS